MLANLYLHWFDHLFQWGKGPAQWAKATLVRYADDFVVMACYISPQLRGWIENKLEGWLELTIKGVFGWFARYVSAAAGMNSLAHTTRYPAMRKPGGALVIVDKVQMPAGYLGTAFSRLTLQQNLAVGADPEAILRKELSLGGYQRPLDPRMMPESARVFFQVGEFVGWVIEAEAWS